MKERIVLSLMKTAFSTHLISLQHSFAYIPTAYQSAKNGGQSAYPEKVFGHAF